MTREYIETQKGTYTAFPENKHEDKTFDIKLQHHIRLIDTVNLSPVGCRSLAQYGRRASAMYHKAYYKGDTYNYDYVIRTGFDIPPTYREIRYTKRDLQLCLYAAMINIYTYRKQLWGRGCYYYATDFPFSATQVAPTGIGLTVPIHTGTFPPNSLLDAPKALKLFISILDLRV